MLSEVEYRKSKQGDATRKAGLSRSALPSNHSAPSSTLVEKGGYGRTGGAVVGWQSVTLIGGVGASQESMHPVYLDFVDMCQV